MSKETEVPKRYAFNFDSDKLQVVFGLPEDYPKRVKKAIEHAAIDQSGTAEMLEEVMNKLQPKNTVEAAYIGYVLGGWTMIKLQEKEAMSVLDSIIDALNSED